MSKFPRIYPFAGPVFVWNTIKNMMIGCMKSYEVEE